MNEERLYTFSGLWTTTPMATPLYLQGVFFYLDFVYNSPKLKGYEDYEIGTLKSYKFQKEFLEEHPERIIELKNTIGLWPIIKEEYKDLIEMFPEPIEN